MIFHGGIHFTKCNFELTSHAISVSPIERSKQRKVTKESNKKSHEYK